MKEKAFPKTIYTKINRESLDDALVEVSPEDKADIDVAVFMECSGDPAELVDGEGETLGVYKLVKTVRAKLVLKMEDDKNG